MTIKNVASATIEAIKSFRLPPHVEAANPVETDKPIIPIPAPHGFSEHPPQVPETFAECLKLWKSVQAILGSRLSPEWRAFISELRKRTYALQQGSIAPHIDLQDHILKMATAIVEAERNRQERIALLQHAIELDAWSKFITIPQ